MINEKKLNTQISSLQSNAREVLKDLILQFKKPEMCYRELIQNSYDAKSPRINIDFVYTPSNNNHGNLEVRVEDFGEGMNLDEQKVYLRRLYSSSKEDDPDTIGRFGIGFVSIFALNPKEIGVESNKGKDSWKLVIDNKKAYKLYKNGERQGTKVTAFFENVEKWRYEDMKRNALAEIVEYCRYCRVPIFVDGTEINERFDIESPVKINFSKDGIEGVIALSNKNELDLFNNRLLLKKEETAFFNGRWKVLLSSKYLNYNLSRNDVIKDDALENALECVREQKDALMINLFKYLEKRIEKEANPKKKESNDSNLNELQDYHFEMGFLWDIASNYAKSKRIEKSFLPTVLDVAKGKKNLEDFLPAEIRKSKIFSSVSGKTFSLEWVVKNSRKRNKVYYAKEKSRVTDILEKNNKLVLKAMEKKWDSDYRGPLTFLKGVKGRDVLDAEDIFYAPEVYDKKDLEPHEIEFLDKLEKKMATTPLSRRYKDVCFADFPGSIHPKVFSSLNKLKVSSTYLTTYQKYLGESRFEKYRLALDKQDATVKNLVKLFEVKSDIAVYLTLQTIASECSETDKIGIFQSFYNERMQEEKSEKSDKISEEVQETK